MANYNNNTFDLDRIVDEAMRRKNQSIPYDQTAYPQSIQSNYPQQAAYPQSVPQQTAYRIPNPVRGGNQRRVKKAGNAPRIPSHNKVIEIDSNPMNYSGAQPDTDDTADESKILLSYTELPKMRWASLQPGTVIRYRSMDGKLKTSGRFNGYDSDKEKLLMTKGRRGMIPLKWSVKLDNLQNIYIYTPESRPPETNMQANQFTQANSRQSMQSNTGSAMPNIPASTNALGQLGDKILFNDSEMMKKRIDELEIQNQKIREELKVVYKLLKKIWSIQQQSLPAN